MCSLIQIATQVYSPCIAKPVVAASGNHRFLDIPVMAKCRCFVPTLIHVISLFEANSLA